MLPGSESSGSERRVVEVEFGSIAGHGREVAEGIGELVVVPAELLLTQCEVQHDQVDAALGKDVENLIGIRRRAPFHLVHKLGVKACDKRITDEQDDRAALFPEQAVGVLAGILAIDLDRHGLDGAEYLVHVVVGKELAGLEDLVLEKRLGLGLDRSGVGVGAFTHDQRQRNRVAEHETRAVLAFEQGRHPHQLLAGDAGQIVHAQAVEQDRVAGSHSRADSRRKKRRLGTRVDIAAQGVEDGAAVKRCVGLMHAGRVFVLVELAADVGRENDNGVAEFDVFFAVFVLQPAGIENLQKKLDRGRVRLFDLVEEQHGIRVPLHEVGQCAGLGVLVEARAADQRSGLVREGIATHVEALEGAVEVARTQLREVCLAHSRRPGEDEQPGGFPSTGVGGGDHFDAEQPLDKLVYGIVLPGNTGEQVLAQCAQALREDAEARRAAVFLYPLGEEAQNLLFVRGVAWTWRKRQGNSAGQMRQRDQRGLISRRDLFHK